MILFDEERLLELRREYQKSKLFCTLYPALAELERRYDELSPTQIWHEMEVFCAGRLLGSQALEMEVIALWNTLLKRYSTFITPDGETIERTPREAEYTAVCVMTCVSFRLVAEPDEVATWNSTEAVTEILKLIGNHSVHAHLYLAQRQREEKLEKSGREIERTPWVEGVESKEALTEIKKAMGASDTEQGKWFESQFHKISQDEWVAFVKRCEAEMTFQHKIDRIAYLVFASHKHWLKGPKTIHLATWVKLMNSMLGTAKQMQQAEVSRKWNEMKNQKFYESLQGMNECAEYQSEHISSKFYKDLVEHVKLMHAKYHAMNTNR